ncbi:MAG: threonine synthase [Pseudomonadota bacterium]
MQCIETRGNDGRRPHQVSFSQAMLNPTASYSGLYAPATLPRLPEDFFARHLHADYASLASAVLSLYQPDIPSAVLAQALSRYTQFDDAQNPIPLHQLTDRLFVNELYHGPTRAFKDIALQPFGALLSHQATAQQEQFLVLAATSGDTGPATLHTFRHCPQVKVVCLYPVGGTSDVQRLQMVTETAPNLCILGVHGNFDDAQAALKKLLFSDDFQAQLAHKHTRLSAANSVNIGRIMFQQIYHVYTYLTLVRRGTIQIGEPITINVPSGNFGNALGAYYARRLGVPIDRILIASNQNHVLTDFIRTGHYDLRNRPLINTNAPAMDILISSNIERLLFDLFGSERTRVLMSALAQEHHYALEAHELTQIQSIFSAGFATDAEVKTDIRNVFEQQGYVIDPHTATCFRVQEQADSDLPSVICATAEWTKFSPVLAEALLDEPGLTDAVALNRIAEATNQTVCPQIADIFHRPVQHHTQIEPNALANAVLDFL